MRFTDGHHIVNLLKLRFSGREWALLPEVRDRAGFAARRSADYIAVNFWPSRGLPVVGLEVKAARSDWLRELKNPAKADAIWTYCNSWYIVELEPDVVRPEELPPDWGLLLAYDGRCVDLVGAADRGPQELRRDFIVNMIRRAAQYVVPPAATAEALAEAEERGRSATASHYTSLTNELEALRNQLQLFQAASGIEINQWSYHLPELGAALRAFVDMSAERTCDGAIRACERALEAARAAKTLYSAMKDVVPVRAD